MTYAEHVFLFGWASRRSPLMELGRVARLPTVLAVLTLVGTTHAAGGEPKPSAVATLFTIGKSQNKNQVQYAIRLDQNCAPSANAPVFAYWRMLEVGPNQRAPLLAREVVAYGIASQAILRRDEGGGAVRLVLDALDRPISIETRRTQAGGGCSAVATMVIAKAPAHLFDVYVKLTWRLNVDYLLLRGWSMDGKRVLGEKLDP